MILRSLRVRLLVFFMTVVLVAVGVVAILAVQTARNAYDASINQLATSSRQSAMNILAAARIPGNDRYVQQLTMTVAATTNTRIIVLGNQQQVIADSLSQLNGTTLTVSQLLDLSSMNMSGQGANNIQYRQPPQNAPPPVRILSTQTGEITLGAVPLGLVPPPPKEQFNTTITRALWIATGIASAVALILTLLLSSAILRPIRVLTQASRRMEAGDLSQRVTITARDEIGELAHTFNTMAESLQRAEQLRRDLVSDVAHELRTPLTNIRGYLEAFKDGVLSPTTALINSLYEEAILLSRLVTDLQDLSLAEADQIQLVRLPVSVEDLVLNASLGLQVQAEAKQMHVVTELPPTLPLVEADPQRVGQIIRNLLMNAITYTPAGGTITLTAKPQQQFVEISIRDTGSGIAPEHLPYLFKRFYRADRSRTRATGGTGLGLAIVDHLVRAHNGKVWVESTVGEGTCFYFTLPIAQ